MNTDLKNEELEINGVKYIKKESSLSITPLGENELKLSNFPGDTWIRKSSIRESNSIKSIDGKPYIMVRTYSAGVFCGYLESRNGQEVKLLKARRIWYWAGAASLSQLATDGTSSPDSCKFPCEVESVELLQVIEILSVTEKAEKSIKSVKIWKQ